jgi:hypothetical protein
VGEPDADAVEAEDTHDGTRKGELGHPAQDDASGIGRITVVEMLL